MLPILSPDPAIFQAAPHLYTIRDLFLTDRAAGEINGTPTEGPSSDPGLRVVSDSGNKLSIDLHLLQASGGASDWTGTYTEFTKAAGAGWTRTAGLTLEMDVVSGGSTLQYMIGWLKSATPALTATEHVIYFGGSNTVHARNNATNTSLGAYTTGHRYRVRIQLKATGAYFYISGGRFGLYNRVWTLVHEDSALNTATLWPAILIYTAVMRCWQFNILKATPSSPTSALDTALQAAINAWQADTTLVIGGGIEQADWTQTATLGDGKTILLATWAMRQDTTIRQIKVNVASQDDSAWAFRVWRWNVGTSLYDLVGGEAFTPDATGVYTHTLETPIAVQMGDIPSLYIPASNTAQAGNARTTAGNALSAAGDITTSNAFATAEATNPNLAVLNYRPFLAITGDSIAEGHNDSTVWHGILHDVAGPRLPGPLYTSLASEIGARIRAKVGNGTVLAYQNYGLGSRGYEWVSTTGIIKALAVQPAAIVIVCGVNDLASFGSTWAQISGWLDTIKAAAGSTKLVICEIFPYSAGDDTKAATRRTWNANLATWCAANGAYLVSGLDASMGMLRESTGYYDAMFTYYNHTDNTHLKMAGVDKLADEIVSKMVDVLG